MIRGKTHLFLTRVLIDTGFFEEKMGNLYENLKCTYMLSSP